MNAPTSRYHLAPADTVLLAGYDHSGLKLDLVGHMDEYGYYVTDACVPGTRLSVRADADMLSGWSSHCDDVLPTSEELRRKEALEDAISHAMSGALS